MASVLWLLLFVGGALALAYRRAGLRQATIATGIALAAYTMFGDGAFVWLALLWIGFAGLVAMNLPDFRRDRVTRPLLKTFRKMLPTISDTEREALEAGTVWWEGELFSGAPRWDRLRNYPAPKVSAEEQAFLDGPCEELCRMLDVW